MAKNSNDGTFHGGFARDRGEGRGVRVALPKPTEMAHPEAPISPQEAGKLAKARKTKLAVMGLSAELLDAGDHRYAACVRLANSFRKARTKEMYEAHGYVSSGVSALLASSAMALAGARYLYELAASETACRPDLLKKASQLSDSSRQNELSAWELCSREAVIRRRNAADGLQVPWLKAQTSGAPDGTVKRGRGRPRKDSYALNERNEPCPSPTMTPGSEEEPQ